MITKRQCLTGAAALAASGLLPALASAEPEWKLLRFAGQRVLENDGTWRLTVIYWMVHPDHIDTAEHLYIQAASMPNSEQRLAILYRPSSPYIRFAGESGLTLPEGWMPVAKYTVRYETIAP